jgi:phospholipid transport system substrate-binding protein
MGVALRCHTVLLSLAALTLIGPVYGSIDPAASQIATLNSALLDSMKAGPSVTTAERYRKLAPVIERMFDLQTMTAFSVGSPWANFSADEQQATIAAFTRLIIASYAHNFREFNGQSFDITPEVTTRGSDKIVQARLVSPHGDPVNLMYRMRESAGSWKIIDVYYGSISQLTTRRSDFAAPTATGGAAGLIAHLNALSDDLMR